MPFFMLLAPADFPTIEKSERKLMTKNVTHKSKIEVPDVKSRTLLIAI